MNIVDIGGVNSVRCDLEKKVYLAQRRPVILRRTRNIVVKREHTKARSAAQAVEKRRANGRGLLRHGAATRKKDAPVLDPRSREDGVRKASIIGHIKKPGDALAAHVRPIVAAELLKLDIVDDHVRADIVRAAVEGNLDGAVARRVDLDVVRRRGPERITHDTLEKLPVGLAGICRKDVDLLLGNDILETSNIAAHLHRRHARRANVPQIVPYLRCSLGGESVEVNRIIRKNIKLIRISNLSRMRNRLLIIRIICEISFAVGRK